ncbi:MAG: CAP domain-containing protein [Acidobacteriota bacterium]|nr:MAG: CAP domain-containing protein [Acidobacteriota bacterium]
MGGRRPLGLLAFAGAAIYVLLGPRGETFELRPTNEERIMLYKANEERTKRGIPPLTLAADASATARSYSLLMAETKRIEHIDTRGRGPGQRLAKARLHATVYGENIAYHRSPTEAHYAFMGSPPHRANLLDPGYREMGVGVFVDRQRDVWVTELFLTRLPYNDEGLALTMLRERVDELRQPPKLTPLQWDAVLAAYLADTVRTQPPSSKPSAVTLPPFLRDVLAATSTFTSSKLSPSSKPAALLRDKRLTHMGASVRIEHTKDYAFYYRADLAVYQSR